MTSKTVRLMPRMTAGDWKTLEELRSQTLQVLDDVLSGYGPDLIYLGAPTHRNFGDTFIWEGNRKYLERLGFRVKYTSDEVSFRRERVIALPDQTPILLHGGGNLGDLWPRHEQFRQHIVTSFPRKRLVLMPQTINFEDVSQLRRAADLYRTAENLTILLRDSKSMDIAESFFKGIDIRFCPDLALGMDPLKRRMPGVGTIVLARSDKEANERSGVPTDLELVDWSASRSNQLVWDSATSAKYKLLRMPRGLQRFAGVSDWPYAVMKRANLKAAERQISSADFLVTDRLHAHILAILLGMPHFVTDNSYGKISAIFNDYTGRFETAHWAPSISDAIEMGDGWRAGRRRDFGV